MSASTSAWSGHRGADPVRVFQRELGPAGRRSRRADEAVPRTRSSARSTNSTAAACACASSASASVSPKRSAAAWTAPRRAPQANSRLHLTIAASYGGRWDIAQAARSLAQDVAAGRLAPEDVDESALAARTCLADLPPPDLFIRTGGETRISNFLLWQLAYTELWFTELLWPDLDAATLQRALDDYASRERRFGLTGAQVATPTAATTKTETPE